MRAVLNTKCIFPLWRATSPI